jgi:hypothetical protein
MYHRSIFLLERLAVHGGKSWESFVLPRDILHL